jgi:uncharacterized repeat protein (TIGR03803 family)
MKYRSWTMAAVVALAVGVWGLSGRAKAAYVDYVSVPTKLADFNQLVYTVGPCAGVAVDQSGNVYGTTFQGGTNGQGSLFKYSPGTGLQTLASFEHATTGLQPYGTVVLYQGSVYGTTSGGGYISGASGGTGTLFQYSPGTGLSRVATFNIYASVYPYQRISDYAGSSPQGGLAIDSQGNIFGTTTGAGANGCGTIFKYNAATGGPAGEYAIPSNPTNAGPRLGGVAMDSQGNVYGTTFQGGTSGNGALFEYSSGGTFTKLSDDTFFANGADPAEGGLVVDSQGNVYGTTYSGGANKAGSIFKYTPGTGLSTLFSFSGSSNGLSPWGPIAMDSQGNIYGATAWGGAGGSGTIYEFCPDSGELHTLYQQFNSYLTYGGVPKGGVTLDSYGNLYGTTSSGGPGNSGTLFVLRPVPEPGSIALLVCGALAGLIWWRRRG